MPYIKSLYPDVPPLPDHLNIYETIIGQPHHEEWPDYTVHVDEETGNTRTFKEMRKRINDLATALGGPTTKGGLELNAENGEMIGILSDNCSDYVVLVIALLKIAVPFASISCYSTPFELKHALDTSETTRLFVAPQYLSKALVVIREVGIPNDLVYVMNSRVGSRASLESMIEKTGVSGIPEVGPRIVPKNTLAWLLFSSGTTGQPKAVMITQGNLLFALRQAVIVQKEKLVVAKPPTPPTPDGLPVVFALLPMNHGYGLQNYCIRGFMSPTRFVIFRRWDTTKVLKAIPKYKATQLSMVPSMWYQVVHHQSFHKTDFSSVFGAHSGAAYLPQEVANKVLERMPNTKFFGDGFGMSETTTAAVVRPFPGMLNGKLKYIPGSMGVLLPGMEARVVREDGGEAGFNEVGELWLKGGIIVSGYFNNAQATQQSFVDGWLRTGDHVKVDEQQYLFFADRVKDTLKVSGAQVSPLEIEGVLLANSRKLISDVVVAGVRGGGRTIDERVPRAWIVLSDSGRKAGETEVVKELERWHQAQLSKYKWLRGGIEVVDELPKSHIGKTLRRILQDRYDQRLKSRAKL